MEKEKPIKGGIQGCLICGYTEEILNMDYPIIAGFGSAKITKDGLLIYDESPNMEFEDAPLLQKFEDMALKEPSADWRYKLDLPLRSAEYQRQGDGHWVLIKKGQGFA